MIPFVRYAKAEPLRVASPFDPVVAHGVPKVDGERHARYEELLVAPAGATLFEVRALGPLEERALQRFMPALPAPVLARAQVRRAGAADDTRTDEERSEDAWYGAQALSVMARAGLVGIVENAPDGWDPSDVERHGTLRLWSERAIGGLPEDTVTWLGGLVARLTRPVDAEKKSGSGS